MNLLQDSKRKPLAHFLSMLSEHIMRDKLQCDEIHKQLNYIMLKKIETVTAQQHSEQLTCLNAGLVVRKTSISGEIDD